MTSFVDFVDLLGTSVQYTLKSQGARFWLGVGGGAVLGGIGWAVGSSSGRLWNRRFHTKPLHHVLLCAAALLTVVFAVVFCSADYMVSAANDRVAKWSATLKNNRGWSSETFALAWERVKRAGTEDFSGRPNPRDNPDTTIPISQAESKKIVASVYADAAMRNFQRENSFIGSFVHPNLEVPEAALSEDVYDFFRSNPDSKSYPVDRGIDLVVTLLKRDIETQIPAIAQYSERMVIILFFAVQLMVFLLVAIVAYRSLTATR